MLKRGVRPGASGVGRVIRWAFVALSGVVVIAAALMAFALAHPEATGVIDTVGAVLPLSTPRIVEAEALASSPRRWAEAPTAMREIDAALAVSPRRVRAWLTRMDVVMAADHDQLSPTAVDLLRRSYALSPLDYTYGPGRLRFAYNHWTALAPADRVTAFREMRCLGGVAPDAMRSLPGQVQDRVGRFAAALNFFRVERRRSPCTPTFGS